MCVRIWLALLSLSMNKRSAVSVCEDLVIGLLYRAICEVSHRGELD